MEKVVDKIVSEIEEMKVTDKSLGGLDGILAVDSVYFGDPGVIPVHAYPCVLVQPNRDTPQAETTGYEIRDIEILVTVLIDARDYFDATTAEADGDRKLVQAVEAIRNWFRRDSKRQLDGLDGVRELKATSADYMPQQRGDVIAKAAQLRLLVNQQRARKA